MIELTNPLLFNGRLIPSGTRTTLPEDFEKTLIKTGNGIKVSAENPLMDEMPAETPKVPDQKPEPEERSDFEELFGRGRTGSVK